MYKKIIHVIIAFYLFSSFITSTHIHSKADRLNQKCQVCVLVKSFDSVDIPSVIDLPSLLSFPLPISLDNQERIINLIQKSYHSQAPPLFS